MPPQRLIEVDQTHPILFHPKALTERPSLAVLVARAIAGWSEIEGKMGTTLVNMLGADASPTLAMFSAINSASAQIDALNAVATLILNPEKKRVFDEVMKLSKRRSKHQHSLAHKIWGYSDALPDALLLIDANDNSNYWLKTRAEFVTFSSGVPTQFSDWPREKILVYRDEDLTEIIAQLDELYELFYNLSFLVSGTYPGQKAVLDFLNAKLGLT